MFEPLTIEETPVIPVAVGQRYRSDAWPMMTLQIVQLASKELVIDLLSTPSGVELLPATRIRIEVETLEISWKLMESE